MEMKTFSSGPKQPTSSSRNLTQMQNQLSHLQREAATRAQDQQTQSQIHPINMQTQNMANPQTHPAPSLNQSDPQYQFGETGNQPVFLQNFPSQMQNPATNFHDLEDPFPSLDLGNSVLQFNRFDDNNSQSSDGAAPTQNIDPVILGSQANQVCPACRNGVLLDHYSKCGILTGIFLFPCGLICCYLTREKACSECKTVFS